MHGTCRDLYRAPFISRQRTLDPEDRDILELHCIRNLNTFCINVHIHEMLLLQKKKGQGINTVIFIPLCSFSISVIILFFLCILLNNFRNLVLLEFGDLDFIFKVPPEFWNLNVDRKKFYALCGGYRISAAYNYWQFQFVLFDTEDSPFCNSAKLISERKEMIRFWWPYLIFNILSWRLIMKYFLRSFSPFRWFKKGSCQFLAKECAQYWLTA